MGENAQEGIFIGTYIFVFIVALSATIVMFTMINSYADLAYEYGKDVVGDGSLIKNVPTTTYRIVTGDQLISYYYDYIRESNNVYDIKVLDKNDKPIFDKNKISSDNEYADILKICNPKKNYFLSYDKSYDNGYAKNVYITIKEIENY